MIADGFEYQISNCLLILSCVKLIEELMFGPSQLASQFEQIVSDLAAIYAHGRQREIF